MSAAGGNPDATVEGWPNLALMKHIAATAEAAKFDMFFLGDGFATGYGEHPSTIGKFEPLTLLSALAMVTSKLGLAATASTTYAEPYHVARSFASLDHLSGGRAGWNVVTHRLCQIERRVRPPASAACRALCHGRGVRRGLPAVVG
jgi:alkanesulfonate monooxygenase SsuD/methylene tetrahydromethanopterin reductase-like flavin-dependent oxidoreductase (luciferase family)